MRCSLVGRVVTWGALVLCALASPVAAQGTTGTVTGTVTSVETKQPLSDARVQVVGTSIGAVTDVQGKYRLSNVGAGSVTLSYTRVGYKADRIKVTVQGGQTTVHDQSLNETTLKLSEVVITGTAGNQERRAQSDTSLGNEYGNTGCSNCYFDRPHRIESWVLTPYLLYHGNQYYIQPFCRP